MGLNAGTHQQCCFNCQEAYSSSQCSWLFAWASSKNHESQAKTLKSTRHRFFSPPPLFAASLGSAQCSGWDRGYFRLWHCHLASGSTCVPEVLILILNRLDTKTNKLSSLRRTGQKNYGHGEGYAITAANLQSPTLCPLSVPPQPPLILNIGGAQRVLCARSAYTCDWMRVWRGVLEEVPPPLTAAGRSGSNGAISFAHHVQLGLALRKEASVANWSRTDIKEVRAFSAQTKKQAELEVNRLWLVWNWNCEAPAYHTG